MMQLDIYSYLYYIIELENTKDEAKGVARMEVGEVTAEKTSSGEADTIFKHRLSEEDI